MAGILFALTLLAAAAAWLVFWLARTLRPKAAFHLAALGAGAALYAATAIASYRTEIPENGIAFLFYVRVFVGALAWAPFAIFVVAAWMKTLGAVAADGETTADRLLEDAARDLEAGHESRAAKTLAGLLRREPDNPEAHALMAELYLKRGKSELALGSLRLVALNPRNNAQLAKSVFKAAGILNEDLGRPAEAARELDIIRRRMPGTPEAAKAQEWIVRLMDEAAKQT